jgi:hypothetical protein
MKKLFLLPIIILLFFSCKKKNQQIAEANVKNYLLETMNDKDSYQSVSFGKLEETRENFESTKEGIQLRKKKSDLDSISKKAYGDMDFAKTTTEIKAFETKSLSVLAEEKKIQNELDTKEKNYKGKINGYKLEHKFRGKNGFNAVILADKTFYLDKNLKVDSGEDTDSPR